MPLLVPADLVCLDGAGAGAAGAAAVVPAAAPDAVLRVARVDVAGCSAEVVAVWALAVRPEVVCLLLVLGAVVLGTASDLRLPCAAVLGSAAAAAAGGSSTAAGSSAAGAGACSAGACSASAVAACSAACCACWPVSLLDPLVALPRSSAAGAGCAGGSASSQPRELLLARALAVAAGDGSARGLSVGCRELSLLRLPPDSLPVRPVLGPVAGVPAAAAAACWPLVPTSMCASLCCAAAIFSSSSASSRCLVPTASGDVSPPRLWCAAAGSRVRRDRQPARDHDL